MATTTIMVFVLMLVFSLAMAQLDDVGTFTLANKEGGNIDVHCHAFADQTQIGDFGDFNLINGLVWINEVVKSTTSILCAFSLGENVKQTLPVWVKNDPIFTLPVPCNDCNWIVDQSGFSIQNDGGQYLFVVSWTRS